MKLLLLLLALTAESPRDGKTVIFKTFPISSSEASTVVIDNINGDVVVERSEDELVHLYVEIVFEASSEKLLSKAKQELELGIYNSNDSLRFFTKAPFIKRCQWGYDMRSQPEYAFKYQYKVKVPANVNLEAKTINDGDVFVKNIDGPVKACNVNGAVEVKNARIIRQASTVNGDVTINFLESPEEPIVFNTVNGDFQFELPEDFSAQIFFDSMNGDLYSSFDYQKMAPRVTKSEKNGKYKIGTKTGIEIGSDGPELSFRSINGNVYLKKSE